MRARIAGFLSNDSAFGRLMTRVGILIAANILFVLCSLPVITLGAAYTALLHVCMKTLREDGEINPFRVFWRGLRENFKQSTCVWLVMLVLLGLGIFDLRICAVAGGWVGQLRYGVWALGFLWLITALVFFPTLAALDNTTPVLLHASWYFALRAPWRVLVAAFFYVFPLYLTYTDAQYAPLYAFIWSFIGFGLLGMLSARLFLPLFRPYLDGEHFVSQEKSERERLEEMRRLDM